VGWALAYADHDSIQIVDILAGYSGKGARRGPPRPVGEGVRWVTINRRSCAPGLTRSSRPIGVGGDEVCLRVGGGSADHGHRTLRVGGDVLAD
jgi:hypothetical protein